MQVPLPPLTCRRVSPVPVLPTLAPDAGAGAERVPNLGFSASKNLPRRR